MAGWLIEVVDMKIEAGEYQNRGFLHLPLCPIYGIGMACAAAGLNGFKGVKESYLILFLFGVIFCSVMEYIVGGILEKLFRTKWWDYSHMRFNIKGRVCLRNAVLFGFGAILVFRVVEPQVERAIDVLPVEIGLFVVFVCGTALIVDILYSIKRAWAYRKDRADGSEPRLLFKSHK